MTIIEVYKTFPRGVRERALTYLKTGVLEVFEGDAYHSRQALLYKWIGRIEKHGPAARTKVLAKLNEAEGAAAVL